MKKVKLLDKLLANPKDFTFREAERLLSQYGFSRKKVGRTAGSRVKFYNKRTDQILTMHKLHGKKSENVLKEGFAKPIAQIKKSKIRLLFVRKLAHSPAIDYVSCLNRANFTSFFFTHQVLQSPLKDYQVKVIQEVILDYTKREANKK